MIKVLAFIKRLSATSPEHFRDYYEHHHAPLIDELLPFYATYRRNYLDGGVRGPLPEGDFDVVTELEFATEADYEGWKAKLADPETIRRIREDEAHFVEPGATRLWVVTVGGYGATDPAAT